MYIPIGPRYRALGGCYPKPNLRLQQLAPSLHQYGAGRCKEKRRGSHLGTPLRGRRHHLKPQISQGAMVRASSHKTIFDKGYMPNWTKEHVTVSQVVPHRRGTKRRVYKLVDYNDEAVKGSWYPEELQVISDNQYRIEKVLKKTHFT